MATIVYQIESPGVGADTGNYFSMWRDRSQGAATLGPSLMNSTLAPGERATIGGSGLSYTSFDSFLATNGGLVKSMSLIHLGTNIMKITGLSLNGAAFGLAMWDGSSELEDFVLKGNDSIVGTALGDTLYGGLGNDRIEAGDGNDSPVGEEGNDTVIGGSGNDHVDGREGNDVLYGGSGNDTDLHCDEGNDRAFGGAGDDANISGSDGNDTLFGDAGNDEINGDSGNDSLFGGTGNDSMYGGGGHDTLTGGAGNDSMFASGENDRLFGGTGDDTLNGGSDEDSLVGGTGNDLVEGSSGRDTLFGGAGTDTLDGGSDQDQFVFNTALGATNIDLVDGFSITNDTVMLDNDIFTAAGPIGTLTTGRFHIGAAAGDAGDRIIYDSITGALYYDSDGTGGAAQVQFATMPTLLLLTAADFQIIG
jgi:Ca2+-binding RTX toxin-like protein